MLCQLNISHKFRSLNFDKRKKRISFIIYHYTETKNLDKAIKLLTDQTRRVSSHYVIDFNGDIYCLVDLDKRAWHAGESMWENSKDINSRSIGIEIVYPGENTNKNYDNRQIKSLIELSKSLKDKFKISNSKILGHSDIAPNRKIDPGIHFPWRLLKKESIGLWAKDRIDNSTLNDKEYSLFLNNLKKFGYPYIRKNDTRKKQLLVINNFHRHHLPQMVNSSPTKSSYYKSIDLLKLKNN